MIDLSINSSFETAKIIRFLKESHKKSHLPHVITGLSGGIDSSLATTLLVKAVGKELVCVALLPYGNLERKGRDRSENLIKKLGLPTKNIIEVDIAPIVDVLVSRESNISLIRKGNIMARVRMILLYDIAKKNNALVCGTENKSEYMLGYFTRFGDEASDVEPIRHLYKTQVKQLAAYLGIPQEILDAVPTAGLWQGQTDERELGFSYEDADQILHLWHDKKIEEEEIIQQGFDKSVVEKVIQKVEKNRFKHNLPYSL